MSVFVCVSDCYSRKYRTYTHTYATQRKREKEREPVLLPHIRSLHFFLIYIFGFNDSIRFCSSSFLFSFRLFSFIIVVSFAVDEKKNLFKALNLTDKSEHIQCNVLYVYVVSVSNRLLGPGSQNSSTDTRICMPKNNKATM